MSDKFSRYASWELSWLMRTCREQINAHWRFGFLLFAAFVLFYIVSSFVLGISVVVALELGGISLESSGGSLALFALIVFPALFLVILDLCGAGALLSTRVALSLEREDASWVTCRDTVWAQRWELLKLSAVATVFQGVLSLILLVSLQISSDELLGVIPLIILVFGVISMLVAGHLFIMLPSICVDGLSFTEAMVRSSRWIAGHRLRLLRAWLGPLIAMFLLFDLCALCFAVLPLLVVLLVLLEIAFSFLAFMHTGVLMGVVHYLAAVEQGQLGAPIDVEIFS